MSEEVAMTKPWVGSQADEWTLGLCGYSPTEEDVACLADAVWHGIVAWQGQVAEGLTCCEAHLPIMAALAAYVHAVEPPCGLAEAVFLAVENRCAVPWDERTLAKIAEPLMEAR